MTILLDLKSIIMAIIIIGCLYCIGFFLAVKIIKISKTDKDSITWKLDIGHSSWLIVHYTHCIFMHGVTYFVPDLYLYTGTWFCYSSKLLTYFGIHHVLGHSFFVSSLKYVIIVHWKYQVCVGIC